MWGIRMNIFTCEEEIRDVSDLFASGQLNELVFRGGGGGGCLNHS
jgi:hypothetical protein